MSVHAKLRLVRDALAPIMDTVKHYYAEPGGERYIIWQEDDEGDSLRADNAVSEQVMTGTVDLFTKREFDTAADEIPQALELAGIVCRLNSTQWEEETGYIHYEWIFEVD